MFAVQCRLQLAVHCCSPESLSSGLRMNQFLFSSSSECQSYYHCMSLHTGIWTCFFARVSFPAHFLKITWHELQFARVTSKQEGDRPLSFKQTSTYSWTSRDKNNITKLTVDLVTKLTKKRRVRQQCGDGDWHWHLWVHNVHSVVVAASETWRGFRFQVVDLWNHWTLQSHFHQFLQNRVFTPKANCSLINTYDWKKWKFNLL